MRRVSLGARFQLFAIVLGGGRIVLEALLDSLAPSFDMAFERLLRPKVTPRGGWARPDRSGVLPASGTDSRSGSEQIGDAGSVASNAGLLMSALSRT